MDASQGKEDNEGLTPEMIDEVMIYTDTTTSTCSTPVPSTSSIPVATKVSTRKIVREEDQRVDEAYNILKSTVAKREVRDASSVFGEYVAGKHHSYSDKTKCVVEHMINNILFDADMGNLEPNWQREASSSEVLRPTDVSVNQFQPHAENIFYVIDPEKV